MYPLDFEEFLWALSTPDRVLAYLKSCYTQLTPLTQSVHETMLKTYQQYLAVGGMPAVVCEFVETYDLAKVLRIQKDLLVLYQHDIVKYADPKDVQKIIEVYNAIPSQLDAKNQRFMVSQVLPGSRLKNVEDSCLWLTLAGIALPCYNLTEPQPPLKLNEKRNLFKLFFLDPGLLSAASLNPVQFRILQGDFSVNQGSILENAVACALKSNGFELYYYNSKTIGELDFVIHQESCPDLLEVKSGRDWRVHRAMNNALQVKDWKFSKAIVLCKGNIPREDGILYLPYYMTMFLINPAFPDEQNTIIDSIDFTDLELPV